MIYGVVLSVFSGIIEALGEVLSIEERGELMSLALGLPFRGLELGESIAVNGCCLTVRKIGRKVTYFDLIPETLEKTTLKSLSPGDSVNLERALTLQKGLSGHLVQGHVDGTGSIERMDPIAGGSWYVEIKTSSELADYLIEKGSIAVDGVSLTVIEAREEAFSFSLTPHTAWVTTLGRKQKGDRVNLEVDLLAKYIKKWMR